MSEKLNFDRYIKITVKDERDIEALLRKLSHTVWNERLTIHWIKRDCSNCKHGSLGAESHKCEPCVYDTTHPNWENL